MSIRNQAREVVLKIKRTGSRPHVVADYKSFEATETFALDKVSQEAQARAAEDIEINSKIPDSASEDNKLADHDWVVELVNSESAYYITSNAAGDAFATREALEDADVYWSGGVPRVPTRNDYAVVQDYNGAQWRFIYTVPQDNAEVSDSESDSDSSEEKHGRWEPQYQIETDVVLTKNWSYTGFPDNTWKAVSSPIEEEASRGIWGMKIQKEGSPAFMVYSDPSISMLPPLTFHVGQYSAYTFDLVANIAPGYVLGSQMDKPLASEAEAEALRTGKANASDLPYALYTPSEFGYQGGEPCHDRAINSGACPASSAFVYVPAPIAGKSRDFFIRLDASSNSSDVPVAVEGATLVGPDGSAIATLTAKSHSVTTWRLTEVENGTTSPSADPVFMVTGANQVQRVMESVTWAQLKAKRDGGILVPGQQYRITDYVATANGDQYSRSANHPFDIIVTADDGRTLNEHARAIMHETVLDFSTDTQYAVGDFCKYGGTVYKCTTAHVGEWNADDFKEESPYFYDCNLAAWNLEYCLDNDTIRFAWADTTNGKGVVYRMVDEFDNDCPYDFKGIQFHPYGDVEIASTVDEFPETGQENIIYYATSTDTAYKWNPDWDADSDGEVDEGESKYVVTTDTAWRYTFDSGDSSNNTDLSLHGGTSGDVANRVFSNKILPYRSSGLWLNRIVFKGLDCYSNTFGYGCNSNTFGNYCYSNTFGNSCHSNTFGDDCFSNTFGYSCLYNTFGDSCYSNTFGNGCHSNTFGYRCHSNAFGYSCLYNTFGDECNSNTFGNSCHSNTFGNYCYSNALGYECNSNAFGDYCNSNTFGTVFVRVSFDYSSSYNAGTYFRIQGVVYRMVAPYKGSFSIVRQFKVDDRLYHVLTRKYYKCVVAHKGVWDDSHFEEVPQFGEGGVLVEDSTVVKSYYRYITFQSGIQYVALNCPNTTSSAYYQNVELKSGIVGPGSNLKLITDTNVNQGFHTTYKPANSQEISVP